MAVRLSGILFKNKNLHPAILKCPEKCFHTTSPCEKVQSGRYRNKTNKPMGLTHEMSLPPHHIAHRKSWNTWNTTTIEGGRRAAETALDDIFIRKFIEGTFPQYVASDIIIKRQHNIIRVAFLCLYFPGKYKLSFLIGYTEELLSIWLQCIVKLEIQIIYDRKDTYVKTI